MLSRVLNAKFVPTSTDAALLLLRVGIGMILFLKHGWEKLALMSLTGPSDFPNLLHLGSTTGWLLALFSDGICSLLIILGLGTRWASFFSFCTFFVAWGFKDHFAFFGSTKLPGWTIVSVYGEILTLFIVPVIVLMVSGPGRYSVDALLARMSEAHPEMDRA